MSVVTSVPVNKWLVYTVCGDITHGVHCRYKCTCVCMGQRSRCRRDKFSICSGLML